MLIHSFGSNNRLLDLMEYLVFKKMPKSKKDPAYMWTRIDFNGTNFLLNPVELLKNRDNYKASELVDYIGLASIRKYAQSFIEKDCSLQIEFCPLSLDRVKSNRLLRVENGRIHFLYERI